MMDECTDTANQEHTGLYDVPCILASHLTFAVKDTLLRLNLSLAKLAANAMMEQAIWAE